MSRLAISVSAQRNISCTVLLGECYTVPRFAQYSATPLTFGVFTLPLKETDQCLRGVLRLPAADIGRHFLQEYGGDRPRRWIKVKGKAMLFNERQPKEQNFIRSTRRSPRTVGLPDDAVAVNDIQFGWECRDGVYSVERGVRCSGMAMLLFDSRKREFQLKLRSSKSPRTSIIVIRASQVAVAFHGADSTYNNSVLYFDLYYPPTYERDGELRQRLPGISNRHHETIQYTSLSMRVICPGVQPAKQLLRLCQIAQVHHEEYQCVEWFLTLPFDVAFQLESISRANVIDLKELLTLRSRVHSMQATWGVPYTAQLLQSFCCRLALEISDSVTETFDRCASAFELTETGSRAHQSDTFECFHVTVTPSIVYTEGPFLEQTNRIIRKYPNHTQHFLRVNFTDEERLQYRFDRKVDGRTFIQRRFGGIMIDGLWIAGRHFVFLAYSLSGLKFHSVWFINEFDAVDSFGRKQHVCRESIIRDLGSFDNLEHDPQLMYCPARYAARISQAFTATEAAVTLDPEEVLMEDDIYDFSGRSFTDGVGVMSSEVATEIWEQLRAAGRRRRTGPCPRAFQIRFGGSKGMLSVDYTLSGRTIGLRQSMLKFESPHRQIEVASVIDKPGRFCLNRPLVMILENLRAEGGYEFLKSLQDVAIERTKEAVKSLETAARLLEAHGLGTSFRLTSTLLGIHKLGFDMLDDPFLHQMLNFAVYHVMRDLKYHARIPVPGGWTLVGVADIHGYLREGEVFACVMPSGATEPIYLEGPMLIARSPVIHPGDVQVVRAVGRPPLRSPFAREPLTNTVVFSTRGSRPLPSCLSGGDLDGDCFVCTTLNGLLPTVLYPPAEYHPATRKILKRPSQLRDIIDFVVEYIYSDNIGMVATEWLITADSSPSGILDKNCLKLAKLHSDATDYPKTGMPVPLHLIPRRKEKTKPDWSAPEVASDRISCGYYRSHRWLGKLYREVRLPDISLSDRGSMEMRPLDFEAFVAYVQDTGTWANQSILDTAVDRAVRSIVSLRTLRISNIREIRDLFQSYRQKLCVICSCFSLRRTAALQEAEVTLGSISAKTSQPKMRQEYMSKMREQTTALVDSVLLRLNESKDTESEKTLVQWRRDLRYAWIARKMSTMEPDSFGARSFGLIALNEIFSCIKHIEDMEAAIARREYAGE
ncbi:hypothetical protein NM688_g3369 [Phlebia brevispora]|uniref:Uncharacterized protein n=1 Tax=Phlebia brevispora TaxID=194682 RepID=A0ACC1T650_9APHY|nr:hypothetical protein NM688_g3369 [Phlebia brevispora]